MVSDAMLTVLKAFLDVRRTNPAGYCPSQLCGRPRSIVPRKNVDLSEIVVDTVANFRY